MTDANLLLVLFKVGFSVEGVRGLGRLMKAKAGVIVWLRSNYTPASVIATAKTLSDNASIYTPPKP